MLARWPKETMFHVQILGTLSARELEALHLLDRCFDAALSLINVTIRVSSSLTGYWYGRRKDLPATTFQGRLTICSG